MKIKLCVNELYSPIAKDCDIGCTFCGEIEVIGENGESLGKAPIKLQGKIGYRDHPSPYVRVIDLA